MRITHAALLLFSAAFVPLCAGQVPAPAQDAAANPAALGSTVPRAHAIGDDISDAGQKDVKSVFGAGCRWDPTKSNIDQVSFEFVTGKAPPTNWYSHVQQAKQSEEKSKLATRRRKRRDLGTPLEALPKINTTGISILNSSYHSGLIDVLTYRARYGSFGSSLNSAGCALPAYSERLAEVERKECTLINVYNQQHASELKPSAMFFWAGISNYDPNVKSDLIQTVVFYGDGCAVNGDEGVCLFAAEFSNFRYDESSHMCMGSNLPVFLPINAKMKVIYKTQAGFRTQESWIDGRMVSYLRSAGDQVMNSFVITQECKGCVWPLTEQRYSNIRIEFSEPEEDFDKLGLCTGGAKLTSLPKPSADKRVWTIEEVIVPAGGSMVDGKFWGQQPTPASATV